MKRKECEGCIYHQTIDRSVWGCAYALETGKLRGCPPGPGCNRYSTTRPKRTKIPWETDIFGRMEDEEI